MFLKFCVRCVRTSAVNANIQPDRWANIKGPTPLLSIASHLSMWDHMDSGPFYHNVDLLSKDGFINLPFIIIMQIQFAD